MNDRMTVGIVAICVLVLAAMPAFSADQILLGTTDAPLEYTGTDIRTACYEINYDYGLPTPIMVGENVDSSVNLSRLIQVPLEKVLGLMCAPAGLEWIKTKGFYIILYPDPDDPVFQRHASKEWMKLDYIDAQMLLGMLNSYAPFIEADTSGNRLLITALEGPMMDRIKSVIKKIDVEVLKQVEIRLVTLEYSSRAKDEIKLESLEMFLGDSTGSNRVNSIRIEEHIFGAVNEDMASWVRLKVLAICDEMWITGDQTIILREGQQGELNLNKKGDIFLASMSATGYSRIEKISVQAGQGVEVEVMRVTSDDEIILHVQGRLEDIQQTPEVIQAGQAIWTESALLNSHLKVRNNRTIEIGKLSRKYSREVSGITSRMKDEQNKEVLFLLTVHIVDTDEAPISSAEERINDFFAENDSRAGLYRLTVGAGAWAQDGENVDVEPIIEAQLRLYKQLCLFGGGGGNLGYFGARYGDLVRLGIGGMTSNNLSSVEPFVSAGISIGNNRVRLEGDYFYLPYMPEENGIVIKLCVGLFGGRKQPIPRIPEPVIITKKEIVTVIQIEEVEVEVIVPHIDKGQWIKAVTRVSEE